MLQQMSYNAWLELFAAKWRMGQHVLIAGPTGSGKTYVAQDLGAMRDRVVVVATKEHDDSLELGYKDFTRRKSWPADYGELLVIFWKKPRNLKAVGEMRQSISGLMDDLYRHGGWTIYFDDLQFICSILKLQEMVKVFYTQVRSAGVSIVSSVQRPFWVPKEATSQSDFVLLFQMHDANDANRVAEGMGLDKQRLRFAISQLEKHEFLFIQVGEEPIKIEKRSA